MKTLLALALTLTLSLLAGEPPTLPLAESLHRADAAEQKRVLDAFDAAQKTVTSFRAAFTQTKRWRALADETKSEGTISFTPPNHFRFETIAPRAALTVCDGKRLVIYYPEFQEAEEYPLDANKQIGEMATAVNVAMGFQANQFATNYDAVVFTTDALYVFELIPRAPALRRQFAKIRIWFDHEFLALGSEILSPNGDSTLMRFRDAKRNEALPVETFQFVLPPGAHVTRPLDKK